MTTSPTTPPRALAVVAVAAFGKVAVQQGDLVVAVAAQQAGVFETLHPALFAAVWAGSDDEAIDFARRVHTGQLDINGGAYNPSAPFGGYKKSGIGRELGRFGFEEYLQTKSLQLKERA